MILTTPCISFKLTHPEYFMKEIKSNICYFDCINVMQYIVKAEVKNYMAHVFQR